MPSALAQSLQVPGISGMENNTVLFEYSTHDPASVHQEVLKGCEFAVATEMDILLLRHTDHFFGAHESIDIWFTWHDLDNANLMILLSYILVGHKDWEEAEIRILAAIPEERASEESNRLREMIASGRIPVSPRNLTVFPTDSQVEFTELVQQHSHRADLVILGFTTRRLADKGMALFERYPALGDTLFVCARSSLEIG